VSLFASIQYPAGACDASDLSWQSWIGVSDPGALSGKIIGGLFIDVFEARRRKIAADIPGRRGTRMPDVIEKRLGVGGTVRDDQGHHMSRPAGNGRTCSWSSRCANCSRTGPLR